MLDPDLGTFVRELLDGRGAGLSSRERLMVIALARHADSSGAAYPSVGLLAKETACERRTVMRILRRLETAGEITTSLNASPLQTNIYQFPQFTGTASSKPSSGQTGTSSVPPTAVGCSPNPTPDAASTQSREPVPPRGKAPSEYKYIYLDRENLLRLRRGSGDSEGTVPSPESSPQGRVRIDREVSRQEWEDAGRRLSYFIADCLIDRGRKKLRYRGDADSEEWLHGANKIFFEADVPAKTSLGEVEQAIIFILDSEEGTWHRSPRDLCPTIVKALHELKAASRLSAEASTTGQWPAERSAAEQIDEIERRRRETEEAKNRRESLLGFPTDRVIEGSEEPEG